MKVYDEMDLFTPKLFDSLEYQNKTNEILKKVFAKIHKRNVHTIFITPNNIGEGMNAAAFYLPNK